MTDNCCESGGNECEACCQGAATAVLERPQTNNPPEIVGRVMDYQFPPLIHRLVEKMEWSQAEAGEVFEDMKRFLIICATRPDGPFAPTEKIDECWHHFILFTQEYASFCDRFFGRFLHHRPRYPEDGPGDGTIKEKTLEAAREVFGDDLSQNWTFPIVTNTECQGSTNCQCSECKG